MAPPSRSAATPEPPYYAVIFTSERAGNDTDDEYEATAARMIELAGTQPGFLGVESARDDLGITVSYWTDLHAVAAWKRHAEHAIAQRRGREQWYSGYRTRIAKVERDYAFDASEPPGCAVDDVGVTCDSRWGSRSTGPG